jgi:G3E family GTPase
MNNGCICCTVRGDLIRILGNLMRAATSSTASSSRPPARRPRPRRPDLLRRRGRSRPFRSTASSRSSTPSTSSLHLDDSDECQEQVAFADVIVLNKTDLVDASELDARSAASAR